MTELPPLAGDGVTDDTKAIQARFDANIPVPSGEYRISGCLRAASNLARLFSGGVSLVGDFKIN